ncbi:hypothetical protein R6Q59_033418, partial [Mikania micrantha]
VGMNKRRRSSETKSSKKERDSSHKKHKSQGKLEERRKHKHRKHDRREISNFKELSDADYFSKNNEFATWLKDERDIFFSDLSSDSARKLFTKFVKDWNNKKLDSKYYDGIETGPRSSHNWKIKSDTKVKIYLERRLVKEGFWNEGGQKLPTTDNNFFGCGPLLPKADLLPLPVDSLDIMDTLTGEASTIYTNEPKVNSLLLPVNPRGIHYTYKQTQWNLHVPPALV